MIPMLRKLCSIRYSSQYLEQQYVNTGKESFHAWHFHSDNAPSHFKNNKTMHYLTKLPEQSRRWVASTSFSFRMFREFGAPGHGRACGMESALGSNGPCGKISLTIPCRKQF